MRSIYDVAIIGGGPAGSTSATLLAKEGFQVIVCEKEKFPRFHIGESLLPYSMAVFERLGVTGKLDARFLPKYGAEICTSCGTNEVKFNFKDAYRMEHPKAYQVIRSEFDQVLLDHARENGAMVQEETAVEEVQFTKTEVSLILKRGGARRQVQARYVIDCSGRNSVIGNFLKLKKPHADLKKLSLYAHYEDVARKAGEEGTYSRLVRGSDRWFWMIPLTDTKMSIGVVLDVSEFKALGNDPETTLHRMLQEQPEVWGRMTQARRVSPVRAESDYSYRNRTLAGERWLLAGDAAGFIDPVFSTGVFIALESGSHAADAVASALRNPKCRARAFKRYARATHRLMNCYLRFVKKWYKPRFIEVITQPVSRFQLTQVVNSMLAGNVRNSFVLWSRREAFYLIALLQRYVPICPRLSLVPALGRSGMKKRRSVTN
jgi:flavin-dependent dehydrogenase